jgi:hypothetical protein
MDALVELLRTIGGRDSDVLPGAGIPVRVGCHRLRGGRATFWALAREGAGLDADERALARRRAAAFVLDGSTPSDLPLLLILDRALRCIEVVLATKRPSGSPVMVRAVVPFEGPSASQSALLASLAAKPREEARIVEARRRRAFDPEMPARRLVGALKPLARDFGAKSILSEVTNAFRRAAWGKPVPAEGALARVLAGVGLSAVESTVEDRSWDPDPEILGTLLCSLRDADDRISRGAFYTPRWIARHLARRALDGYLADRTGADGLTLESIRSAARDGAGGVAVGGRHCVERIAAALDSFRACDPAAGTGSLLVALFQEMMLLREGIARARREAITREARRIRRRAIAARSLYGIDADQQALALCAERLSLATGVAPRDARANLLCADLLAQEIPGPASGAFPTVFDAVITNPPYLRQERIARGTKRLLACRFPQVFRPKSDLSVFFVARAAEMVREGGHLSIVTNGKFLKAGYGEGLRECLACTSTLTELIDLGDLPVFRAAAYPVLLSARRAPPPPGHRLVVVDFPATLAGGAGKERGLSRRRAREVFEPIDAALSRASARRILQARLGARRWDLEGANLADLEKRWERAGRPLGDFVEGRMFRGVVTGLNAAFVIDQRAREELLTRDPRAAAIVHPWVRGRDVHPWRLSSSGLWLLFMQRGIDLGRYRGVREHLARFRARLTPRLARGGEGRKPGRYRWYEIQDRVAYAGAFAEPKIVFSKFVTAPRFAWDESGSFTSNATGILPGAPMWILALLQSDLLWRLLRRRLTRLQNGYWQIMNAALLALPILEPNAADRAALAGAVKRLASGAAGPEEARALADRCEAIVRRTYGVDRDEALRLEECIHEGRVNGFTRED